MKNNEKTYSSRGTLYSGLLTIVFAAVAFGVLYVINLVTDIENNAKDWYMFLLIAAAFFIEWLIMLGVLSKGGSKKRALLALIPLALLLVAIVLLYVLLKDKVSFFAISGINTAFGITILVCVTIALIAAYQVVLLVLPTREERRQEVIMRVVGKNDPDAEGALGTVVGSGLGEPAAIKPSDMVFPDLVAMDEAYRATPYTAMESEDLSLEQLADGFGEYLESRNMYYSQETIRSFISGMACSHLIILEGISGMGKTSLPRYFAEYTQSNVNFTSVQSSWRDKGDVLGYYNDFVGTFKETPFLRALYKANYETDSVNLLVLDEMNLSRVEYYFADFLSILELDEDQWQIGLMPISTGGTLPEKLDQCSIKVPHNVWFVGTANNDDSTYVMSDKVYDRAIVVDFSRRKERSASGRGDVQPVHIGSEELIDMFDSAANNPDYQLTQSDIDKFNKLCDFVLEAFDVSFGNRILNQLTKFVPVYVACGGTTEKALDLLFSRKILRKLGGRFDEDARENLEKLERLVNQLYGKGVFTETADAVAKLKRKMF